MELEVINNCTRHADNGSQEINPSREPSMTSCAVRPGIMVISRLLASHSCKRVSNQGVLVLEEHMDKCICWPIFADVRMKHSRATWYATIQ